MGDIYEFDSNNKIDPKLLLDNEIKKQMNLLKDSIWYHGVTERSDAENRILNNGEFLVRFSEDTTNKFVVSSKWNGKYIHIIILTDIDAKKNCLVYFINPKFKFPTILELIKFHKENQYPLSDTSEAVLYKPVDPNHIKSNGFSSLTSQRESKFRKSTNMFRKHTEKKVGIPRCGSETYLTKQRYSEANLPDLNKSLTDLSKNDSDAPHKPKKPSFKLLNSKHLLLKLRPSNIKIRNKKLYKESGDYSDYSQVKDAEGALKRERLRRGLSSDNRSPSLFGLNLSSSSLSWEASTSSKKLSLDQSYCSTTRDMIQSDYVMLGKKEESVYVLPRPGDRFFSTGDDRDSVATLTANTPNTSIESKAFDVYGFDTLESTVEYSTKAITAKSFGLVGFVNLSLSTHPMTCVGPVESVFDKVAINRASALLLSHVNHHLVFCKHLLDELTRVFVLTSMSASGWQIGYRSIFLSASDAFQRDLSIRQTVLTLFIMATIVSTASTEKRINLIFFWIKCADYLLTHIQDMYHFRAVFSAIFSEQILNLRVWKLVHRQDPSLTHRMACMKEAIKNGCLLRTDIDKCVPDLVQLCNVFSGNEDDLVIFSNISLDIAMWSDQAFSSPSTWLKKISKELDSISVMPFFREMVQTETLLCMILGRNSINFKDVTTLFEKVNDSIRMMVKLCNDGQV